MQLTRADSDSIQVSGWFTHLPEDEKHSVEDGRFPSAVTAEDDGQRRRSRRAHAARRQGFPSRTEVDAPAAKEWYACRARKIQEEQA